MAEKSAKELMSEARSILLLANRRGKRNYVFYAHLALSLDLIESTAEDTAFTDGSVLGVNPAFVKKLKPAERITIVAHEVLHVANKHFARQGSRDAHIWNIACDAAINPLLAASGFKLPSSRIMPGENELKHLQPFLAAEEYYPYIQQIVSRGAKFPRDPSGCGIVRQSATGTSGEVSARIDRQIQRAYELAKMFGNLPLGLDRLVKAAGEPLIDWRSALYPFLRSCSERSLGWWPERKFLYRHIYIYPSLVHRTKNLRDVVFSIDASGSIHRELLDIFMNELSAALRAYRCTVYVLSHDAQVHNWKKWKSEDGELEFVPKGGGGTDHRPVFDWIEKKDIHPSCAICFTDLWSQFPERAPDYPVMWVTPPLRMGGAAKSPDWGVVVPLR